MPSVLYTPQKAAIKTNPTIDPSKILEKVEEKPPPKKTLAKGIRKTYEEFCGNTSIHGFQYFGQHRPRKEIFFWIVVFAITIYFCTSIIVRIYVKWYETPVIVSFSEKSTPIWNIPFPRVTICPETKRSINKTAEDTFVELYRKMKDFEKGDRQFNENFTRTDLEDTLTLMHICNSINVNTEPIIRNLSYTDIMSRMLPNFDKYFHTCAWFGNETSCNSLFKKVYTDEGICYVFNTLKADDMYREDVMKSKVTAESKDKQKKVPLKWSLEEGYAVGSDLHTYPARVLTSGSDAGLTIYLQSFLEEMDYSCNGPIQGFKVMLHSPDDVPSVTKHFVRISMEKEVMIAIKPNMITTSADIAAYDPEKRRCFMNKDRQLRFYKVYSQNNCERECLTNYTLGQCKCVHFAMPRTENMTICAEDKIECYMKAHKKFYVKQFKDGSTQDEEAADDDDCNCLPACTSLDFETEISEGYFDLVSTLEAYNSTDDYFAEYPGGKMSRLVIYFKENQFITSRRSELYGITELVANFGGVLGLFMGVSILSVVEIIYHFTLRLWERMMG
uniref:Pickpocket protein 28-like n=1 Tax=Stomoxys calcitrans TaxID=35570 RepID=A0A1I8Q8M8_STOCA